MIIWITGLSGTGKSTLARALSKKHQIKWLDGDFLRSGLNSDLDFSKKDRIEAARRAAYIAGYFDDCIVSMIAPFRESREFARSISKDFCEIYLHCSEETLKARDYKGIYDDGFPIYENGLPELVFSTDDLSVDEMMSRIRL